MLSRTSTKLFTTTRHEKQGSTTRQNEAIFPIDYYRVRTYLNSSNQIVNLLALQLLRNLSESRCLFLQPAFIVILCFHHQPYRVKLWLAFYN
jgi:hypothetical protein